MSEVIKNIKQLVDNYINSNPVFEIPGSFVECFYFNNNNGSNFNSIAKNLGMDCKYFLLKVLRETPYDTIKEKLGDNALLWLYESESQIRRIKSDESGVFWFSPEQISLEKISETKYNELKAEIKKYNLL